MNPIRILNLALYAQLLLGLTRFVGFYAGFEVGGYVWGVHRVLAFAIVGLALVAFRPLPGVSADRVRTAARYFPLAPLALGVAFWLELVDGALLVVLHMALGLATIGFVHAARARQRRALGA